MLARSIRHGLTRASKIGLQVLPRHGKEDAHSKTVIIRREPVSILRITIPNSNASDTPYHVCMSCALKRNHAGMSLTSRLVRRMVLQGTLALGS